ncbi:MAG: DUF2812 domain-containing protein [Solobacterium sp.]|nr:DUF2812 domain-containing protein [Solobacterium sp.]
MTERRTIRKWFFVWDFDKEEQWLNEMAMNGWALCSVGFCTYTFERCEPGQYMIRLEMHGPDEDYIRFMEETGCEYVGRVFQWIYFRRSAEYGEFDIFSDIDSRIAHLNRIATAILLIAVANLLIGFMNVSIGTRLGSVNLILASLLTYGLGRIHGKIEALEKERFFRE